MNKLTPKQRAEQLVPFTVDNQYHDMGHIVAERVDLRDAIEREIAAFEEEQERLQNENQKLKRELDGLLLLLAEADLMERLGAQHQMLNIEKGRKLYDVIAIVKRLRQRYAWARDGDVTIDGLMVLWEAIDRV